MTGSGLTDWLSSLEQAEPASFPNAHYNTDGDCIEVFLEKESYRGVRIDDLITVYVSQDDESKIVGAILKNVKRFISSISEHQPGMEIDFSGSNLKLEYLLTAAMWNRQSDKQTVDVYLRLREVADERNLTVDLQYAA